MLQLFILLVFSVLICDGQLIGAPFYPKAIGLGGGGFGGGGSHFVGGGGQFGGGGGQFGGAGHWYPGLSIGGFEAGGLGGSGFVEPKIGIEGAGIGGAGFGGPGIGIGAPGLIGGKIIGGEEIDRSAYEGGKKNFNNQQFVQSHGKQGGQLQHGNGGFTKGQVAEKNVKGDSAFYSDANGGKNLYHQGKDYQGGQHFEKEGHGGNQQTRKKGHKKGHKIKGYKTSHHLDEHGGSEEYYDEEHDEGGNYAFNGESAGFGKNGASSFKGGEEGGKYNSGERKKSGHYGQEYISDKAEGNEGKYGSNKYAGHGGVTGEHKVIGSDDISGYEDSRKFFKKLPIHY